MTSEQISSEIKQAIEKLKISRSIMEDERNAIQIELLISIDALLTKFAEQIDDEKASASTLQDRTYLQTLYIKTLEMVQIGMLPGQRMVAA